MKPRRLVLVESPYRGIGYNAHQDLLLNIGYLHEICRYLADAGEAPYASHMFCTQFLDDSIPEQRDIGIEIGLAWGAKAEASIVGIDRGIRVGMLIGIERARRENRPIEWLSLPKWRGTYVPSEVATDWTKYFDPDVDTLRCYDGHLTSVLNETKKETGK